MTQQIITLALPPGSDAIIKQLALKGQGNNVLVGLVSLFDRISLIAAGFIVRTELSGSGNPGLKRRTGSLARSITGLGVVTGGVPGMRVGLFRGPALDYGTIQEYGGTVRPVNTKYLAMPVNGALTPAGVPRYPGPRQYPGHLVFVPFKVGSNVAGALYEESDLKKAKALGNLRAATALYLMLRQSTIPAHNYLYGGMTRFLPQAADMILTYLKGVLSATP